MTTQYQRYVILKRGKKTGVYHISDNLEIGPAVPITQIIENGPDCYPWHEVFAWLPVKTVSDQYVWGQKIFKRKVWVVWGTGFHMEPEVQYATAFDLLSDKHQVVEQ